MEIHRLETDNSQNVEPEKSSCRHVRWLHSYQLQNIIIHHLGMACVVTLRVLDARQRLFCASGHEFGADRVRPAAIHTFGHNTRPTEDRSDRHTMVDRAYVLGGLVETMANIWLDRQHD
jgi:hypothetical protein